MASAEIAGLVISALDIVTAQRDAQIVGRASRVVLTIAVNLTGLVAMSVIALLPLLTLDLLAGVDASALRTGLLRATFCIDVAGDIADPLITGLIVFADHPLTIQRCAVTSVTARVDVAVGVDLTGGIANPQITLLVGLAAYLLTTGGALVNIGIQSGIQPGLSRLVVAASNEEDGPKQTQESRNRFVHLLSKHEHF